ncbi:hypothetical protein HB662_27035 [Roseomonas frigidaquae]|uniref:Uncharacterized protein n=1 Tax=Falsiroseomonas frigidaquae TaxID=487318 RepID=A0ABX1F7S6_9PROT|nr:hypothetical protein [Falsiroseomonas frigidaquae]NKE48456.1 hypothetical protein [Falsiroseomonas frigidaquae]
MDNPARRKAPPRRPEAADRSYPPRQAWAPPAPRRGSPARGLIWAVGLSAIFWGAIAWGALGLLA